MKKTGFLLLVSFAFVTVNAQLKNTKWKGTIKADEKYDVVFDYKNDTLEVSSADDGSNIETLTYAVKDSVLTLQKVYGKSNCDGTSIGKYNFHVKDNLLYVTLISDICDDRTSALNNSKWTKVK